MASIHMNYEESQSIDILSVRSGHNHLDFVVTESAHGFTAICASKGIFTQGKDKQELLANILDAATLI